MRVRSRQIAVGAVLALAASGLSALTAPTVSAEPCGGLGGPGSSPLFGSSGSAGMSGKNPQGPQGPLPRITGNTQSIAWVTGPQSVNDTYDNLAMSGTDLGITWDNGAGQILMAFGDTFGDCSSGNAQWRSNALFRSDKASTNLSQGITIGPADPANTTSGAVVRANNPRYAAEIISSAKLPSVEDTTIPTAAIAIGNTQYINYMSVQSWGTPGRWITNYSATAKSTDNGQNWTTDPKTIRVNKGVTIPGFTNVHESQGKFQQSAYVLGQDGRYLYQFGTPNGRFGDAFVSRVAPDQIENLDAYEYSTQDPDPAKQWSKNVGDTVAVVKGPVSEMSVAWNDYLGRYVMMYGNENNRTLVARTAENPEGPWSEPRTILDANQTAGGIYAPFIHPMSSGKDLYFTASRWSDYNVMLLKTNLDALK
ncbi:MAG: DUF4185 domain-containing protein [Rhodococcus sp. (in: high G+C Gram-positive bacteria)]|nr:MAG: DUF4185 domain-containing protein [Rhodococcus sp. (in: high G+C Gram-positive bacteria)]